MKYQSSAPHKHLDIYKNYASIVKFQIYVSTIFVPQFENFVTKINQLSINLNLNLFEGHFGINLQLFDSVLELSILANLQLHVLR